MIDASVIDDPRFKSALAGDEVALAELFEQYRTRLGRTIALRMDPRVQGRLDASDVLQDAFFDAAQGLKTYAADARLPFFLWLRLLTCQRLAKAHRKHLGAAKRAAQREVRLHHDDGLEASTVNLASYLVSKVSSASARLIRMELRARVQAVLNDLEANDREVLALRHFEEMSIKESALVLGISETAASSRYRRALLKMKQAFERDPQLLEEYGILSTGSAP